MSAERHGTVSLRFMVATLLLLAVVSPRSVSAGEVVYTNFGPGYSLGNAGDYTDFYWPPDYVSEQIYQLYGRFLVGNSAFTLDAVRPGISPFMDAVGHDFTLWLTQDAGGVPGAIIETMNFTGPLAWNSWVQVDSSTHPLLEANTSYWIGVTTVKPNSVVWRLSPNDPTGKYAIRDTAGLWVSPTNDNFALEVIGTAVPDPGSTLLLFGMGVAGLTAFRKWRG
jgi:hypothetical protein